MIQVFKNIFVALDNHINPIAVKEMRQAVRSRYITLLLQLYLLTELLITSLYLLLFDTNNLTTGGVGLFTPLIILLFIVNLICVPVYTSNRLAKEVRDNDAMFSTTLTPMQIVRGKFYCGLIISLLLFSAAAPFIILTYLLRGLDIPQILSTLYWTFLLIQTFNCYGIVFGALNINNVIRAILAAIMGFTLFGFLESLPYSFSFVSTVSSMEWEMFFISTLALIILNEAFMTLAACLMSPISFNRMTRPRIFASASSLLLITIALIHYSVTSSDDFIVIAFVYTLIISLTFLGIGLCERTTLSVRQIQQIPRNPILRVLAFPFFTGVGSAIAWFVIMFTFLTAVDYIFVDGELLEHLIQTDDPFPFFYVVLFYSTCGMLIRYGIDYWRRNTLNQRIPEAPAIIIYPTPLNGFTTVVYTLFLIAIPTVIPMLFAFTMNSDIKDSLFYFSPFKYLDTFTSYDEILIPRLFGFASSIILILFSAVSFIRYFSLGDSKTRALKQNAADKQ